MVNKTVLNFIDWRSNRGFCSYKWNEKAGTKQMLNPRNRTVSNSLH